MPVPAGNLSGLQAGPAGHFYYLRRQDQGQALHHYDLVKRKDEVTIAALDNYGLSADGKKVVYVKDKAVFVSKLEKVTPGEGRLPAGDIEVHIDPRAEWQQIFDEAWRINRDYFYDAEHARRRLESDASEVRRRSCRTSPRART